MTTVDTAHVDRIRNELKKAGISPFAMLRFTARYLPKIIHDDEHIEAAVFGRHKETEGLFGYVEGILVATDRRIIYLDHKPGFTTMDEISYDVVSAVSESEAGARSSLTLFTKMGNYILSFARPVSVRKFADYIEKRRIDEEAPLRKKPSPPPVYISGNETTDFLKKHDTAVLSTIDRAGNISGATVYYFMEGSFAYILTKEGTRKSRNMMGNQQIALTIYDSNTLQTAQIQGKAEVETDPTIKEFIFQQIVKPRHYESGEHMPPVTSLRNGAFIVFRITPTEFSFSDFSR